MLAPLDNGTIFKKAFTDKIVFTQFVKDILEVDIDVDKIETEKQFKPKSQFIDIKLDIFAQSKDKRIIIEIQKVEYDHHFDRFQYYFFTTITEQQKSAKKYKIDQTVYSIVVLTTPYTINQITGAPIENEVLIQSLDPETLDGDKVKIGGHMQIFLNPHYQNKSTPKRISDWLKFIYASIKTPEKYKINTNNIGIKRASEIIDYEKLDEDMFRQVKIDNETKALHAIIENKAEQKGIEKGIEQGIEQGMKKGIEKGKEQEKNEMVKELYNIGVPIEKIVLASKLSTEKVKKILNITD